MYIQQLDRSRLLARLATVALVVVSLAGWATVTLALDPATREPAKILRATFATQPARSLARVKMSIRDNSGERERTFSMRTRRESDVSKLLMLIEGPADMRDTGFLSITYSEGKRANEQWIYLPKLHRVSRVADSGKSDSFAGSDFTLADLALASNNAADFELKLLDAAAKVGSDECWVIESVPRTAALKTELGYERLELWVSKSKAMVVQFKGTVAGTSNTKYFKALDIKLVGGVWTAQRVQMRTLNGSALASETTIEYLSVDNDAAEVKDSDFTQQRLGQGA